MKKENLKKLGLEKILNLHGYSKEEVIFIGRIYNLMNSKNVVLLDRKVLRPKYTYSTQFYIGVRKEMDLNGCMSFLSKRGFPLPTCFYVKSTSSGVPLRYFEYHIDCKTYELIFKKTGEIKAL